MDDQNDMPATERAAPPEPALVEGDPARRDDAPGLGETETRDVSAADNDPQRPYRVAAWLVIVGSLALASFLVALPAHVYEFDFRDRLIARTRRLDVIELWRVQANNLPDLGQPGLIEAFFILCALIVVVGSTYLIWIATVDIIPTRSSSSISAGTPGESEQA